MAPGGRLRASINLGNPILARRDDAAPGGAAHFAIHVLESGQREWLARFARGGSGFSGLDHSVTTEGLPALDGALARFDCAAHAVHDGGDHAIVIGRVLRVTVQPGQPLVFAQGRYGGFAG